MITKGKQILHNADFLCNIKSANAKINKTSRWNDRGFLKQSLFVHSLEQHGETKSSSKGHEVLEEGVEKYVYHG